MIDTGFMFGGTKAVEVLAGVMLLANLWVPLVLVIAFPVTVGIWSVDLFLISSSIRAQILGWSVLLLNTFLLLAYLRHFSPMLVARGNPFGREGLAGRDRAWPTSAWASRALAALGSISVALGVLANGWLILMVIRPFMP